MTNKSLNLAFKLAQPFLSFLDAETAHSLTLRLVRWYGSISEEIKTKNQEIQVAGLKWPNRVGLAAGFDKNGIAIPGLSRMGFGFIEIGAVTPLPQQGNTKPRLFRVSEEKAVINRMGFNNEGLEVVRDRLQNLRSIAPLKLGVNIGRNATTTNESAIDDYAQCLRQLAPFVDFITVNVSSPNTPGLIDLQEEKLLGVLLHSLTQLRAELEKQLSRRLCVFVKVSPDLTTKQLETTTRTIEASACDGIVATNTTTSRFSRSHRYQSEEGGMSGQPLFHQSLDCVQQIRKLVSDGFAVIGVGGIFNAQDARSMLDAGADLIQLYTGLVYRGPSLVDELVASTREFK